MRMLASVSSASAPVHVHNEEIGEGPEMDKLLGPRVIDQAFEEVSP
jgi:hypothetical protein